MHATSRQCTLIRIVTLGWKLFSKLKLYNLCVCAQGYFILLGHSPFVLSVWIFAQYSCFNFKHGFFFYKVEAYLYKNCIHFANNLFSNQFLFFIQFFFYKDNHFNDFFNKFFNLTFLFVLIEPYHTYY